MSNEKPHPGAYWGNPALKEKVMAKIAHHRKADALLQGAYAAPVDGKMTYCAVGCLLEDPDGGHYRYASEFGIPTQLAYLEDNIFESLPPKLAKVWPERFMGSIPVGGDLSGVWPAFAIWLLIDAKWGAIHKARHAPTRSDYATLAMAYQTEISRGPLSRRQTSRLSARLVHSVMAWTLLGARYEPRYAGTGWRKWVETHPGEKVQAITESSHKLLSLLANAPQTLIPTEDQK